MAGLLAGLWVAVAVAGLLAVTSAGADPAPQQMLTVTIAGGAAGAGDTVTSDPAGISCTAEGSGPCSAQFDAGSTVTLTATPGTTATSSDGFAGFSGGCSGPSPCTVTMSGDQTVTATFDAPPTISVTTPAAGDPDYAAGTVPDASYTCDPSGVSCDGSVDGTAVANGAPLPATAGSHTLVVTATGGDGQKAQQSAPYTVSSGPGVSITSPTEGAAYPADAVPDAQFKCESSDPYSQITSCTATADGHPIANGAPLPATPGSHSLSVTATDISGRQAGETVPYTVLAPGAAGSTTRPVFVIVAPPSVTIAAPAQNATYRLGQKVRAAYSCSDPATGPGLRSCTGPVAAGKPIDTSTLGQHRFTVTGADKGGESTSETITYTVVPTTNAFIAGRPKATSAGVTRIVLRLPGPGKLRVVAHAWNRGGPHVLYARLARTVRHAGRLRLTIRPTASGRALVRTPQAAPVIALTITYTPTGGRARTKRPRQVHLRVRP